MYLNIQKLITFKSYGILYGNNSYRYILILTPYTTSAYTYSLLEFTNNNNIQVENFRVNYIVYY